MRKLLAYADAGQRTGFERVARGILTHLNNTGQYDITCMGIGYNGQPELKYPYEVRPASTEPTNDLLGVYGFQKAVEKHRPDVIWMLQDVWNVQRFAALKNPAVPMACYFPIDAPNLKWHFAVGLGACGAAASYTEFGAREAAAGIRDFIDILVEGSGQLEGGLTEKRQWVQIPHPLGGKINARLDRLAKYQNGGGFSVIPHGHDHALFEPRDQREARVRFGIPQDAFIVANVNTNQFRKRQDLTFRAFAYLAQRVPNARLVLHCAGHTIQGWDLDQLARYFGVADRVHFIHEMRDELTDDELVDLYNTADVMINTSGGEGWGLPAVEGAACGVPQMVPDWSVTRELWKDAGMLLPVSDFRMEPKFLNTAHGVIDPVAAGQLLVRVARRPELLEEYRQKGFELVRRQWTWDQVGAAMEQVIDRAIAEPPLQPMSIQDCVDVRVGDVRSELQGVVALSD